MTNTRYSFATGPMGVMYSNALGLIAMESNLVFGSVDYEITIYAS